MKYCAVCGTVLMERYQDDTTLLFCSLCGGVFAKQQSSDSYKYLGTTNGNHPQRDILEVIDKEVSTEK